MRLSSTWLGQPTANCNRDQGALVVPCKGHHVFIEFTIALLARTEVHIDNCTKGKQLRRDLAVLCLTNRSSDLLKEHDRHHRHQRYGRRCPLEGRARLCNVNTTSLLFNISSPSGHLTFVPYRPIQQPPSGCGYHEGRDLHLRFSYSPRSHSDCSCPACHLRTSQP